MPLLPDQKINQVGPSVIQVEEALREDALSGGTTYYGYAVIGASDSEAVWKIKREVVSFILGNN